MIHIAGIVGVVDWSEEAARQVHRQAGFGVPVVCAVQADLRNSHAYSETSDNILLANLIVSMFGKFARRNI
jgi:hypothetical protein